MGLLIRISPLRVTISSGLIMTKRKWRDQPCTESFLVNCKNLS